MGRVGSRAALEDGPRLDINALIRDGFIKPGELSGGRFSWTDGTEAVLAADMRPERTYPFAVVECGGVRQEIVILCTPAHFGGVKWFFRCPKAFLRVSILYKPAGSPYFASRRHYGRQVAYKSQFLGKIDLVISRQDKLRRQLGGSDNFTGTFPDKPVGMRWPTYEALRLKDEELSKKLWLTAEKILSKIES